MRSIIIELSQCEPSHILGQGRLDGAFCDYTEEDKIEYLKKAHSLGCRNVEMESCAFSSLCHRAGVRGAVVCVTLIDRLQSDLMSAVDVQRYDELVRRPHSLIARFIKRQVGLKIKENRSGMRQPSIISGGLPNDAPSQPPAGNLHEFAVSQHS